MHERRGSSTRTAWPSAAMPSELDPSKDARLVHARRGYSFEDAYVARAVMGTREGGASRRDAARFDELVRPRLAECSVCGRRAGGPRDVKGAPWRKARRDVDAAPRRHGGLRQRGQEWRWCWCVDSDVATAWAPRVEAARRRLYGG